MQSLRRVLIAACLFLAWVPAAFAGQVFGPTPETVALYEFNEFTDLPDGTALPEGAIVPDLSGLGHDATVDLNGPGDLVVGPGDTLFDDGVGANRECQRQGFGNNNPKIVVNEDDDAFEMQSTDDFSIELYVNREIVDGGANWGILAGTWHSRNLLDDTAGDPDNNGAWYGYGLIRNDVVGNPGAGGEWSWVFSPVVDGIPRIGFGQAPEQNMPFFAIPEGRHYVVASINRVDQTVTAYVDGAQVSQRTVDENWSFTTPDGYEHARFMMFTGEDDPTRGQYRGAPAGTHLDAVRVQRKAVTADEVTEAWDSIQSGATTPPLADSIKASVLASASKVIPTQCVKLSGETSRAGPGKTITKYEWKVADGPFEEGGATKEVSFDTPNDVGHEVQLRITNSAAETAIARAKIKVALAPIAAKIAVSLNGQPIAGNPLIIPRGSVLTLDGSASGSKVPFNALLCPIVDGLPVPPLPVTSFRWDLDGKLITAEDTRPTFDTPAYNTLGEFPINLQVRDGSNQVATASLKVKVVDAGRKSQVFGNTDDTLVHFEFNGLSELDDGLPLANGLEIEDLSPNKLNAVVEGNDTGDLTIGPGSSIYDTPVGESREIRRTIFAQNQPRLAINDDADAFEMTELDDFSVELFVDRETVTGSANWGILAGTWHSRNLLDDAAGPGEENGAWYGFGLIRNDKDANPPSEWAWVLSPVVAGVPRIGFAQAPEQQLQPFFDIPEGRHYVVMSVDRVAATAVGYVDGVEVCRRDVPADWTFQTPDGYEHARFLMFAGEDDPTVGQYRGSPAGTHLDAVRVQRAALQADVVIANWEKICTGDGTGPDVAVETSCTNAADDDGDGKIDCADTDCAGNAACLGTNFHRGDADDNGVLQLTDAIRILGFLFLGGQEPTCLDAADADDNGVLQLTDAIRILGFLFLGGPPPAAPGPPPDACGIDAAKDLGCVSYTKC